MTSPATLRLGGGATRRVLLGMLLGGLPSLLLVTTVMTVHVAARAGGPEVSRCERFAADAAVRGQVVTGRGERVVVIGDSYSVGLGLEAPVASWASRLPGSVRVAGFSGSGFSAGASGCAGVSFAERAAAAVAGGADLVVVEGGLNDVDRPTAEIRAGFERLVGVLEPARVVVVGPPTAPARAAMVPRVDRLLARLAAAYGIRYVPTSHLDLTYLSDDLHLTQAGHRAFGDHVASALTAP